jgi:hypothetical protein
VDRFVAPRPPVPSECALLDAARLAPEGFSQSLVREIEFATWFLLFGLPAASGLVELVYRQSENAPRSEATSVAIGAAAMLAVYLWCRFVWPRPKRRLLGRVDETALQRLLLMEAVLASEQAGLITLTLRAESVVAAPTGAAMMWPAGSLEYLLLRRRPLDVAQLVVDARAIGSLDVFDIADRARRRTILRENPGRRGPMLVAAEGVLRSEGARTLSGDCRAQRPALWAALQAAIADGLGRDAARSRSGTAGDDARLPEHLYVESELSQAQGSYAVGLLATLALWVGVAYGSLAPLLADGADVGLAGLKLWPSVLAVAVALAAGFSMRKPYPAKPRPERGSPDEEAALARARLRRNAVPSERPPFGERLLGGALLGGFVGCAATFLPFIVVLALVVFLGLGVWAYRGYVRMPTSRELQLAVARRSRELTAAAPQPAAAAPVPRAAVVAVGGSTRPMTLITPDALAPAAPDPRDPIERRRALAAQALRWNLWGVISLVVGMAATSVALWWREQPAADPSLLLIPAALLGVPMIFCLREALRALHALRPRAWMEMPGIVGTQARLLGPLLRLFSADGASGLFPDLARALHRELLAPPDFWRNSTLRLAAPLGAWPWLVVGVCLVGSTVLALVGLTARDLAFGLAGLAGWALVAGYALVRRGWHSRLARLAAAHPGQRLVLLRVFGSPSFDDLLDLVRPWLLRGPISHLEGYDSIARSVEAGEALAAGRLDEVLVASPEQITRHLAVESTLPDSELRYRRDAFQCTDAIWQIAIRALLDRAGVVVMDLSSLSPRNAGCAYELGLLLDRTPLSRVVLLVNDSTDLDCLRGLLDEAETRMALGSPNRMDPREPWQLLKIGGLAARAAEESMADWRRRLDVRLEPLQLVRYLAARLCGAGPRAAA